MLSLSMHALQLFTYFGVNYCGCVAHAALDPLTVEVQRYTSTHMRKNLKNFSSWLRRSTRIATGNSFLAHTYAATTLHYLTSQNSFGTYRYLTCIPPILESRDLPCMLHRLLPATTPSMFSMGTTCVTHPLHGPRDDYGETVENR